MPVCSSELVYVWFYPQSPWVLRRLPLLSTLVKACVDLCSVSLCCNIRSCEAEKCPQVPLSEQLLHRRIRFLRRVWLWAKGKTKQAKIVSF